MCSLCGAFMTEDHWAESGRDAGGREGRVDARDDARRRERRRERARRVRLVNRVLGHHHLRLEDWDGRAYVLRDGKGGTAIVDNLGAVWTAAGTIAGRELDPLEGALLDRLRARAAG